MDIDEETAEEYRETKKDREYRMAIDNHKFLLKTIMGKQYLKFFEAEQERNQDHANDQKI